jgi:hypothetical protein
MVIGGQEFHLAPFCVSGNARPAGVVTTGPARTPSKVALAMDLRKACGVALCAGTRFYNRWASAPGNSTLKSCTCV